MKQVNITEADNIKTMAKPQKSALQFKMLLAMALLSISMIVGACGENKIVGPDHGDPIDSVGAFDGGVITFTANGQNVSLPGSAINFVLPDDTIGIIGGFLGGVSAHFDTLNLFQPNANGPVYLLTLFFGVERGMTLPFTDSIGGHVFSRWDENTFFSSNEDEIVSGSITYTAITDSTLSGTFEAIFVGDVVDRSNNIISSPFTMNITNGQFEIPIRNLEL